jgi:hypothetical protein
MFHVKHRRNKMKTGILVDVTNKTVTKVEFDGIKDMYRLIDCEMFECVGLKKDLDAWVDEEGLLKDDGKDFVQVRGYDQPLKGNVLFTGGVDGDGATRSCEYSILDITAMIHIMSRREVMAMFS